MLDLIEQCIKEIEGYKKESFEKKDWQRFNMWEQKLIGLINVKRLLTKALRSR